MESAVKTSAGTPFVSPRERLLAAADELFYEEGIHTVGIDRIIEKAGVAKATLYSAFGSKEGLVRAYLQGRLADRRSRVDRALAEIESPRERILAVFDVLGRACEDPRFHGCAFVNASAESAPGSAAVEVSDESRAWNLALFTQLAAEAGAAEPADLARRLMQLYDGANVAARMDRDPAAAALARSTAAVLVDAAVAAAIS
jgi:AcrR family transcriptional regulator